MSYSKTTWKTGDTITAQLLNHAEDGIAANDAAIAAIPAGVQLYGPYRAINSAASLAANKSSMASLTALEDVNGATVSYPQDAAKLFICGLSSGSGHGRLLQEIVLPSKTSGKWTDGYMIVYNNSDTAASETVYVNFYSTAEFPQESSQES